MNILEIGFAIVFIFFTIRGFHDGILRMVLNIVGLILIFAFVNKFNPIIYNALKNTPAVTKEVDNIAEKYVEDGGQKITESLQGKSQNHSGTAEPPDFMRGQVADQLEKLNIKDFDQTTLNTKINSIIKDTVSTMMLKGISVILAFLLGMLILFIIRIVVNLIGKIPIIHGASKIFGAMVGMVEGLLIIWLALFIIRSFAVTGNGEKVWSEAEKSSVIMTINEYNPIYDVF